MRFDQMTEKDLHFFLEDAFKISDPQRTDTRLKQLRQELSRVSPRTKPVLLKVALQRAHGYMLDVEAARQCGCERRTGEQDEELRIRAIKRYTALVREPKCLRITPNLIQATFPAWSSKEVARFFAYRDHLLLHDVAIDGVHGHPRVMIAIMRRTVSEPDVRHICALMRQWCDVTEIGLEPIRSEQEDRQESVDELCETLRLMFVIITEDGRYASQAVETFYNLIVNYASDGIM